MQEWTRIIADKPIKWIKEPTPSPYYTDVMTFDTETTSYMGEKNDSTKNGKCAFVYIWQMCINGKIYYGRTIDEFFQLLIKIKQMRIIGNHKKGKFVIYVHNLSFDFQFLRNMLGWTGVFALKERDIIRATYLDTFEFRCSYKLTNKSLETIGNEIGTEKKVGDLDYRTIRTPATELTPIEMGYCAYDVIVLHEYVKQLLKSYTYTNIPMTSTGFVRQETRTIIKNSGEWEKVRKIVKECSITDVTQYNILKSTFSGGFTHANYKYVGQALKNVKSWDISSSYPTRFLSEKFPYQFREFNDPSQWEKFTNDGFAVYGVFILENIEQKSNHSIISYHKCLRVKKARIDNGRIMQAEKLAICATDIDIKTWKMFYDFDIKCVKGYWAKYEYLPKSLIKAVYTFYQRKTELKGIVGEEQAYLLAKQCVNGLYGMCVTDILRDNTTFTQIGNVSKWGTEPPADRNKKLEKYANNKNSFLLYQWGVWITAYSRRELLTVVEKIGNDVIYCDTDSVKILNAERYSSIITDYNAEITTRIKTCLRTVGLPENWNTAVDKHGNTHDLGIFDDDGSYNYFKTLGAKRYIYMDNSGLHATVAGCPKKLMVAELTRQGKNDSKKIFSVFNEKFRITLKDMEKYDTPEYMKMGVKCKHTHTYIDDTPHTIYVNGEPVTTGYGVYLELAPFSMKWGELFEKLMCGKIVFRDTTISTDTVTQRIFSVLADTANETS